MPHAMRGPPADLGTEVGMQIEDLGADHQISVAHGGNQAPAKTGANDQVRAIAPQGHLGRDPGAFLADAEGEQGNRFPTKIPFIKIEMGLANEFQVRRAVEDGVEFLLNGDEDGDHAVVRSRARGSGHANDHTRNCHRSSRPHWPQRTRAVQVCGRPRRPGAPPLRRCRSGDLCRW